MELIINTKEREEIIDITEKINELVDIEEGVCFVFSMHTTAGLIVNENDDSEICGDILSFLRDLVPKGKWKHDRIDGNGDSHIKNSILDNSVCLPVEDGKLKLGRWQALMFVELDGPRERRLEVKVK